MSRIVFFTATTLDGYLADEHHSLDWLMVQDHDGDGAMSIEAFMEGVGSLVMGASTYEWVLAHLERTGEDWPYTQPCFVFTHRDLRLVNDDVVLMQGSPDDHIDAIRAAADGKDVWMLGGGALAADFAEAGHLDQLMVSIAPVTLGAGAPLFPRRFELRLTEVDRNGSFVCAWFDVVGPGNWDSGAGRPTGA